VISLAIPSNLLMPTGFVLAERTLFLASAGAMVLIALGLARLWQSIPAAESSARTVVTAMVSVLVVAGALRSSARNPAWHDSLALMRSTVEDVPMSSRAHWMLAEQLERAGQKRQSVDEMLIAVKLGRPDDFILLSYAGDLLLRAGAYDGALPLYRNALSITPHNEMLRSNAAVCLVQLGRFDEARRLARAGLVRPNPSERLKQVVARTDSLARIQPKGTS
jgi:tetratricopeptide (TPR) repeat protein